MKPETQDIIAELGKIAEGYSYGMESYDEMKQRQMDYLADKIDPEYECGDDHFECTYMLRNGDEIYSEGAHGGYRWKALR